MQEPPSPSRLRRPDGRQLPAGSHLDTHRGSYRLRVTITQGEKFVGVRICQPLRTRDPIKAAEMRDLAVELLARCGCLTRDVLLTPDDNDEVDAKTPDCQDEAND